MNADYIFPFSELWLSAEWGSARVSLGATEVNGAVIRDKHGFLLQVEGTSPNGQPATLKLAGRYFWMWGHLYVARVLRSVIRVQS